MDDHCSTHTHVFRKTGFTRVCVCVYMQNLLSQDGVADVFRSQTISVSNSDSCSRTFYMITPSNDERSAWVDAIQNNIQAHAVRMT